MKKRNIFVRFFCAIGRAIKFVLLYFVYILIRIFSFPFTRCKVKGKENVQKDDEARVFISNHYEMYGPLSVFLNFPYKFRPWIIDKMMNEKDVEQQMGLMVYNNYKHVPKFIKTIVLKCVKSLVVFAMHHAKGISVSREEIRANLKTMEESTKAMEKGYAISIFPELWYRKEGVGEFQTGFVYLARYYYKKTGKKISFYPMFISEKNKSMYIGERIIYDPENDANAEKEKIITYLHGAMIKQYEDNEVNNSKKKKDKK